MIVVPANCDRRVWSDRIDQILGGKLRAIPVLFVPIAPSDPFAFGAAANELGHDSYEFCRTRGSFQLDAVQSQSAVQKVDVSVIKSRQHQLAGGIYHARFGIPPCLNLTVAAHSGDAVTQHSNGLGLWFFAVHRVDIRVDNDQVGCRTTLTSASSQERQEEKSPSAHSETPF